MKKVHILIAISALFAISCESDAAKITLDGPTCEGASTGHCASDQVCEGGTCKNAGEACETATSNHNGYGYCLAGFSCSDGDCHVLCGKKTCNDSDLCCDVGDGPVCLNPNDLSMTSCTTCKANYDNCDGNLSNGCEPLNDKENCGRCGNRCVGDSQCVSGECTSPSGCENGKVPCAAGGQSVCLDLASVNMQSCSACIDGFANCDNDLSNGCESNTRTDPAHCGGCGRICEDTCINSTCQQTCDASHQCSNSGVEYCIDSSMHLDACETCSSNYGNCDANWTNGCETDLLSDANHCGSCENNCEGKVCVNGHCVEPCGAGEERCTSDNSTYCMNPAAHHMSGCDVCATGFDNCDADWSNGCETILGTRTQCNRCDDLCEDNQVCSKYSCSDDCDGTEFKCSEGNAPFCVNASTMHLSNCENCANGYANCNETLTDGCELDLNALHLDDCEVCKDGYANCDDNWANGCEVDLNASHLKACDQCADNYCLVDGACITNDSAKACGASCSNCESMPYTSAGICSEGICIAEECEPGYEFCNGVCVDIKTNAFNCGACGIKCDGTCSSGICTGGDTTKTCGAIGGIGCELPEQCCTNLETAEASCRAEITPGYNCFAIDNKNCGLSHKDCNKEPNAKSGICTGGGLCQITECQFGFHLSKLDPGNECIGNMHEDCGPVDNIGVNCNASNHSTKGTCTQGYCVSSACEGGYQLCGGVCVDIASNAYNCGVCGRSCGGSECVNGACSDESSVINGCMVEYGSGCNNAEQCCTNLITSETTCSLETTGYNCVSMNVNRCGGKTNCESLPHVSSVKCMGGGTCQITKCQSGFHVDKEAPGNQCVSD